MTEKTDRGVLPEKVAPHQGDGAVVGFVPPYRAAAEAWYRRAGYGAYVPEVILTRADLERLDPLDVVAIELKYPGASLYATFGEPDPDVPARTQAQLLDDSLRLFCARVAAPTWGNR